MRFAGLLQKKLYMSTEQGHLHKPDWYNKVTLGAMKDGLISSAPDTWKIHRSVISKAFTYNSLQQQLTIFEEHAKRFVLNLHESNVVTPCLSKPLISFDKQVNTLTFEIISHIALGKEMDDLSNEEKTKFSNTFQRLVELVSYRFRNPVNLLNLIWKLNPLRVEMDQRVNELTDFVNKVMGEIRMQSGVGTIDGLNIGDDMAGKSLSEVMIKAGFSKEEIFAEISTFFSAGHETTSNTLKLLLFILANNKEYQAKCREEIDRMFDQMCVSNTHEISMEALNSLSFLDMCIKECLRLYPVAPIFGRVLKSPMQIDENIYLPRNTFVVTSPLIIHHNPKVYPEPEKFKPDRFLPENMKKRGLCDYMPFSAGPRNCIGFKTATNEIKLLVAYVLHNFEVRSEKSIDDLNEALRIKFWPYPDLDIEIHPRP